MVINEPVCLAGGALAVVFFLLINLGRFQIWLGDRINNNKVTVVVYKAGKEYRYSFSTVEEAAKDAIKRVGNGERVAYIEKGREKVWDAFAATNKHSLWKLSGEE